MAAAQAAKTYDCTKHSTCGRPAQHGVSIQACKSLDSTNHFFDLLMSGHGTAQCIHTCMQVTDTSGFCYKEQKQLLVLGGHCSWRSQQMRPSQQLQGAAPAVRCWPPNKQSRPMACSTITCTVSTVAGSSSSSILLHHSQLFIVRQLLLVLCRLRGGQHAEQTPANTSSAQQTDDSRLLACTGQQ